MTSPDVPSGSRREFLNGSLFLKGKNGPVAAASVAAVTDMVTTVHTPNRQDLLTPNGFTNALVRNTIIAGSIGWVFGELEAEYGQNNLHDSQSRRTFVKKFTTDVVTCSTLTTVTMSLYGEGTRVVHWTKKKLSPQATIFSRSKQG